MRKGLKAFAIAGLAAAATSFASAASAQSVEEFYKGKQLQVVIYTPGGSTYDMYARFLIQYMGKHLPGNPTFIPRNMPGAGGIAATQFLNRIAPKDGTVFGNRERLLPRAERGFYREYTVPTPGSPDRGARRIVCGGDRPKAPEACFYTADHYASFKLIAQ
jgi:hypothetical protein